MSLSVPVPEIVESSDDPLLQKPDHWDRVRLGDIANILNGCAFSSEYFNQDGEGLPLIRIRDVDSDATDAHYSGEYDQKYIVEPGDLLIGMDGDFKSARWYGPKALLNQRVCKVTLTSDEYEPRFLDSVLPGYLDAIHQYTSSVTVKHLSSKSVANIPLPFPSLGEQKRLADKIEELFSNLDAGLDCLQTAKRQLERYRLSVLRAAVEGRLTAGWRRTHSPEPANQLLERILEERREQWEERYRWERYESKGGEPPSGWKERYPEPERPEFNEDLVELPEGWLWTSLEYICEMTSGGTPKRTNDDYFGGEIAWLKSGELDDDIITNTEESITEKGFQESSTVLFPEGTLLVALYGATTGKLGILDIEAATNQAICGLYVPPNLNTRYLFWYLRSARSDLLGRRFGGAQKNLSQTILKTIPVPLPPLREQEQIVDQIERTLSIADDLRSTLSDDIRRSKRLRQSILRDAFSGRLTQS